MNNLKKLTKKNSLEDAFISLTGDVIRDEEASTLDRLRMHRRGR